MPPPTSPGAKHDVWGRVLIFAPQNLHVSLAEHRVLSWVSCICKPGKSGRLQVVACAVWAVSVGFEGIVGQCPQHSWTLVSRLGLSAEMSPVGCSSARAVQTYLKLRLDCLYVVVVYLQAHCKVFIKLISAQLLWNCLNLCLSYIY